MRGYPDFFGMPIFEKYGPLVPFTLTGTVDTLADDVTLLSVSNKGILVYAFFGVQSETNKITANIETKIDGTRVFLNNCNMPEVGLNGQLYAPGFQVISDSRVLGYVYEQLDRELPFSTSIEFILNGISSAAWVYALQGAYKLLV